MFRVTPLSSVRFGHDCASSLNKLFSRGIRSVNIRWWPTLENPWVEKATNENIPKLIPDEKRVEYETSREEFKWVEKVLPKKIIPPAPSNIETPTPSGWIAPNAELSSKYPYSVRRTKNHMLPIYYEEKQRKLAEQAHGIRQLTVIKHINGDMWVSNYNRVEVDGALNCAN
ncbi:unnamed protein product [Echinostoma caproni]|uniref:Large ribosomal subunit protein mL49 n=1 Tax=Echinostoma caproni TaxID=27848 RepID=A0A183B9C3_9TREM|nr:unnamed protein product [Echinostoma caproni]